MKILNDQGYKYLEINDKWNAYPRNDWAQLRTEEGHQWNWYTFTFIQIEIENDVMMGDYEFTFILLGLGFYTRYHYTDTETTDKLKKQVESIKNGTAKFEEYTGLVNDIKSDEE